MSRLVRVTELTVGPKSHIADRLKNRDRSQHLEAFGLTSVIVLNIGIWLARVSAYVGEPVGRSHPGRSRLKRLMQVFGDNVFN
jgi:hypothetical protein